MAVTRREFIQVAAILAAGAATLNACAPLASYLPGDQAGFPNAPILTNRDWRALNRLSFGPRQEDRQRLEEIGLENYLEEQLSPDQLSDPITALLLNRFDVLKMDADGLRNRGDKLFDNYDPALVLDDFRQATLLRQVYSKRQLEEVMVEFWTDHFNISVQKGDCWFLKVVDDREVIRKHVLGSFRELLGASAHSPAMLVYLDNQENHRDAPNENYARELLELHTLGLNGGYDQNDVMEMARCLTGWRVKEHFWRGEINFDPDAHSPGSKQVLDQPIPGIGKGELDLVLDQLAEHPSTARTICSKLARRFLADEPSPEIISKASQAFQDTHGDIKSILRVILLDGLKEIPGGDPPLKYKRPINFVVSALRLTGTDTDGGKSLQRYLKQMGQPLYDWPTPDGYPDTAEAWQGNLLPRWRFALDLVEGRIPGTKFDLDPFLEGMDPGEPGHFIDQAANHLLGGSLPTTLELELLKTLDQTVRDNPRLAAGILISGLLASPAFQYR